MVLHLNKLEFPICTHQGCTVAGLVEIGPVRAWFWRRRFLNFVNAIFAICNYLPLEKGGDLHESPLPKASLVEIGPGCGF